MQICTHDLLVAVENSKSKGQFRNSLVALFHRWGKNQQILKIYIDKLIFN